jgi:UDP-N-acetyl-D-mannosaminuronic acid transferase (WecB/TagA/CpsF family)
MAGYEDGNIPVSDWPYVISKIINSNADTVVVGLGGGLQEAFAVALEAAGFSGSLFTCGGFIRQGSNTPDLRYYPRVVNQLHFRAVYRFIYEPHTRRRYLLEYPANLVKLLLFYVLRRVTFIAV